MTTQTASEKHRDGLRRVTWMASTNDYVCTLFSIMVSAVTFIFVSFTERGEFFPFPARWSSFDTIAWHRYSAIEFQILFVLLIVALGMKSRPSSLTSGKIAIHMVALATTTRVILICLYSLWMCGRWVSDNGGDGDGDGGTTSVIPPSCHTVTIDLVVLGLTFIIGVFELCTISCLRAISIARVQLDRMH